MSWTSAVGEDIHEVCLKERRSGHIEAISAALLVAIALAGLTCGLRAAESAARNVRAVVSGSRGARQVMLPGSADGVFAESQSPASACPGGMVLVEGDFCPEVEHKCVRWMETEGPFARFRCAEYARPAKCLSPRVRMRYCVDRDEYVPAGEELPASRQSWTDAKRICEGQGKRLCGEAEWVFACEGEEMRPYPYGFSRDAGACNADREDIYRADGTLRDLRDGADGHPACVSPFGVHHLTGNLEEWTTIDGSGPPRPAMKGAYWQPGRNHCRAAQTAHDEYYSGVETGFRCCRDAGE